jgi:hypothetical protein
MTLLSTSSADMQKPGETEQTTNRIKKEEILIRLIIPISYYN